MSLLEAKKPSFREAQVKDPVEEYLALVAEKERRDKLRKFELYEPYEKQKEWLNWNVPVKTIFGGNRCLGGETMVFDPVLGVSRRVDSIAEDFHVWAWDGEKRVIAEADRPFKKAPQKIYRFTFEDGTEIMASPSHLFFGMSGWIPAEELIAGFPLGSCVRLLPSCLDGNSSIHLSLKVSKIDYIRTDDIWDFTVDKYANYFIGNVLNHNTGKTYTAAYEMVCHLTGLYPEWWEGKRFYSAIEAWAVALTNESARDIIQKELLGDIKTAFGSGMIPKDLIIDHSMRQGVADTVDTIWVRHVPTGGISILSLKSNEQGREKMQGTAKNCVWVDEECDHDVFTECRLRTMTVQGITIVTFTPLKGLTSLAKFLLNEPDATVVRRVIIGWDDVPHLSKEDKRQMSVGLLPHEIEARRTGLPTMATGLIYPFLSKDILVKPFELETFWPGIVGLDVAFTAPTAGALLRYDRASRTTYMVDEHYLERQPTSVHASGMKRRFGEAYPIRIDPSANRSERDGENIIQEYRAEFGEAWEIRNANNAVYSGISKLYNAMSEGRFKVFSTCRHWIDEWQNYVWDESKKNASGEPMPKKKNDHVLDATRYAYMDIEDAKVSNGGMIHRHPLPVWNPQDPFTGY